MPIGRAVQISGTAKPMEQSVRAASAGHLQFAGRDAVTDSSYSALVNGELRRLRSAATSAEEPEITDKQADDEEVHVRRGWLQRPCAAVRLCDL